jgi:hypothetical protein
MLSPLRRPHELLGRVKGISGTVVESSSSSGMATELAAISRAEFLLRCGEYGVTVFQQTPEELEKDVKAAHATREL